MLDLFTIFLVATVIAVILSIVFAFNVYESGVIAGRYYLFRTTKRHKKWVDLYLFTVLLTVLFIKLMLLAKRGDPLEILLLDTYLGTVHAGLIIIFLVSVIVMRWFLTGEKNPLWHKRFKWGTFGGYAGICVTGAWLLVRLLA